MANFWVGVPVTAVNKEASNNISDFSDVFIVIISTLCPEKCHFIFDYNSRISWSIFKSNFCIFWNRNEYSTLICNLLTNGLKE